MTGSGDIQNCRILSRQPSFTNNCPRVLIESHLRDRVADYINNTALGNKDGDKEERIKVAQRSSNELIN